MEINNTLNATLISGTAEDDTITNAGINVTINSGEGNDTISLNSDSREYVAFSYVSNESIGGFEVGTLESSDAIYLADGDMTEITFDFTSQNGFSINMHDGTVFIESSSETSTAVDIIIDDKNVRAVGDGISTAFDSGVGYYRLGDASTLTGATGTISVNDMIIEAQDNLTITSYTETKDGAKYNFVNNIYGITAGNSLTIKNYSGDFSITYNTELSDDNTAQIIRTDNNKVVWTGTPDELAALDFMEVDKVQYFLDKVDTVLEEAVSSYVTLQNNKLTFDLKSLRTALEGKISQINEELSSQRNVTADAVIETISKNLSSEFGITLEKLFSESTIENLKTRIADDLKSKKGILSGILSSIDTDGLMSFVQTNFVAPLNRLGVQVTASDLPKLVEGESIIEETIAGALFENVFADKLVAGAVKDYIDNYREEIRERITSQATSNTHINFELDGTSSTLKAGLYISGATSTINALASNNDINIIASNFNNSEGEVVIGSSGNDLIFAGAGDSVNSGRGNDQITFASGTASVVTKDVDPSKVDNFSDFLEQYFVGANFEDDHSRQYVGLDTTSSDTVFGFEVGTEDYSDVVYLIDGSLADLTVTYDSSGFILNNSSGTLVISSRNSYGITSSTTRTPQSPSDNILIVDTFGNMNTLSANSASLNNTVDSITFTGTLYDNNITNSGNKVTIAGGEGKDTVNSSGDNNIINGGAGDDKITNSGASSNVNGEEGDDEISNSGANSNVNGGAGDDDITNSGANSNINGGSGADTITNNSTGVKINGDEGNDDITNNSENVTVSGGAGDDDITNSGGNVSLSGGDGGDKITNSGSNATISGGEGNDYISNNAGNVNIIGDLGNDRIYSTGDSVAIEGGAGNNSIFANGNNLEVSIGRGNDYISVSGSNNKVVPIKGYAAVNGHSNTIIASGGNTTVEGNGGNDFLVGNGQTYFDLNSYSNVTISAKVGDTLSRGDNDIVSEKDGRYSLQDGEITELTYADSSGDDYVRVFEGENITLQGGKDTIDAPDAATISGYDLSSGMVFVTNFGNVTNAVRNGSLNLGDGTFGTNDNMVTLDGYTADRGNFVNFMNNGAGQLYGWSNAQGMADGSNYKNEILIGTQKNSTLIGGTGNDTLYGSPGDYLNGGAGQDLIVLDQIRAENSTGATIFVNTSNNETLTVNGFNNSFGSDGDKISGINLTSATVTFSDGVLTVKNGHTELTVNNSATFGDTLTPAIGGEYEFTRVMFDDIKTAIADEGNVINIDNDSDNLATAYIGSNSGVDWSDYEGSGSVTLSNNLGNFNGTTVAFSGINKLKAGKGNSTLIGDASANTLVAGEGAASIWGGGSSNDYLVGLGTDQSLATSFFFLDGDGNDTINNFNFKTADTETNADEIQTGGNAVTDVKISGDDVTLGFTRNTDKLVIKDAVGQDFQIEGVTAQVANNRLNFDEIADYYQAVGTNATVNVSDDVDSAEIWLDNSHGTMFVGNIVNLNAASVTGDATLVGNSNNNTITASAGNSSLWGGVSGNDLLIGGNGEDMFFYLYGNGNDTIRNASSVDKINLSDVNLGMIEKAEYTNGTIKISFNDGNSLVVDNYSGSTFSTAQGNFSYNRSSRQWTEA